MHAPLSFQSHGLHPIRLIGRNSVLHQRIEVEGPNLLLFSEVASDVPVCLVPAFELLPHIGRNYYEVMELY